MIWRSLLILLSLLGAANAASINLSINITNAVVSFFNKATPTGSYANDPSPSITLGMQFSPTVNGTVNGVLFYKDSQNTSAHIGSLWSSSGTLLASVTFSGETASGWQSMNFSTPVNVTAGTTYVVSYHTSTSYHATSSYFTAAQTNNQISVPVGAGFYSYNSGNSFPTSTFQNSNYWVDVLFQPGSAPSNTVSCNGTQSDCQAKVNAASDGTTVAIPAGTFSWASPVSWTDKNITVQGAGIGNTILNLTGEAFSVTDPNKASFRISGMTLQGGSGNDAISLHSDTAASSVYGWRIDHISITGGSWSNGIFITGINWGVIDHSNFNGNMNGVVIYAFVMADFNGNYPGPNGIGATSWALPLNLGTTQAVYVEDSTFVGTGGGLGVNDMEYGARLVFRHNTASGGNYIQSHSARDSNRGGSLKMEIYNNTFTGNNFTRGSLILAGTGVIFNNTITGYGDNNINFGDQRATQQVVGAQFFACDGTHSWDGNIETTGWPCMDQIGRGPGALGHEPTVPYLLWNNGTTSTCASGGTCDNASGISLNDPAPSVSLMPYISTTAHTNGDKDYCIGTSMPATCGNYTSNYTPLVYPHPLTQN